MESKVIKTIDIKWKPNKNKSAPLYSQIVSYFNEKISNGDWIPGQKLPSQRELADAFSVNRSTIVEAMDELESMGLIEGRAGSGTFIINDIWSLMMSYATPNWETYIEGGKFMANKPTIQTINMLEYKENIIRLGTGEMSPDLFPAKTMKKILSQVSDKITSLNYLPPLGLLELRKILCTHLSTKGIHVSPDNILIVSGALQALQLLSICILPPNSTVYLEKPSYLASLNIFPSAGTILRSVEMDENGIMPWAIKPKELRSGRSLLYTIPSFQNPTGLVMPKARRLDVLNYGKLNKMPIIEDDNLTDLWLDNPPPLPIKAHDTNGIVLYIGSVSKSLAPGFRVGWIVGPEPVMQRLADVKMQTDYGSSSLSQWAVAEWLESGSYELYLKKLRVKLKARRDFMLEILESNFRDIATWTKPEGSYYVWMRLKNNITANKIFQKALKKNILLNPGDIYDPSSHQFLRLSYAYESYENLEKGLLTLAEIIRKELSDT